MTRADALAIVVGVLALVAAPKLIATLAVILSHLI